jgi:hypothetical protein
LRLWSIPLICPDVASLIGSFDLPFLFLTTVLYICWLCRCHGNNFCRHPLQRQ